MLMVANKLTLKMFIHLLTEHKVGAANCDEFLERFYLRSHKANMAHHFYTDLIKHYL